MGGAAFDRLAQLRGDRRGQVLPLRRGGPFAAQKTRNGAVGADDVRSGPATSAPTVRLSSTLPNIRWLPTSWGVEPAVLDRQPELLEQVENQQQLLVEKLPARDAPARSTATPMVRSRSLTGMATWPPSTSNSRTIFEDRAWAASSPPGRAGSADAA